MASKNAPCRKRTSVRYLRRPAGRRPPTTNSLGTIWWRPGKPPREFERLLGCLVEANQAWAKAAPVLVLGVVSLQFAKNKQNNRAAVHDLGLAAGNLSVEATARGLSVHQMIGILPDKAREVYRIPEHFEAWTAMAIGYKADPAKLPDALKERDLAPRQRRPLGKFVFTGQWGQPSPLVLKRDT